MDGQRHTRRRNTHRTPERVGLGERAQTAASEARAQPEKDLHVCPRCSSELVQPGEWAPVDAQRWRVELSCPDCGWFGADVFSQRTLDRYDEILDEGAAVLVSQLHELAEENMRADVDLFCAALGSDLILPEDF
jgi:transcription elongation factor Elf1